MDDAFDRNVDKMSYSDVGWPRRMETSGGNVWYRRLVVTSNAVEDDNTTSMVTSMVTLISAYGDDVWGRRLITTSNGVDYGVDVDVDW